MTKRNGKRPTDADIDAVELAIENRTLDPRGFYAGAARSLLRLIMESELAPVIQAQLVGVIATQASALHAFMNEMLAGDSKHTSKDLLANLEHIK